MKLRVHVYYTNDMVDKLNKVAKERFYINAKTRLADASAYVVTLGLPSVKRVFQPPKGAKFFSPSFPVEIVEKLEMVRDKNQASSSSSVAYTALVLGLESLGVEHG